MSRKQYEDLARSFTDNHVVVCAGDAFANAGRRFAETSGRSLLTLPNPDSEQFTVQLAALSHNATVVLEPGHAPPDVLNQVASRGSSVLTARDADALNRLVARLYGPWPDAVLAAVRGSDDHGGISVPLEAAPLRVATEGHAVLLAVVGHGRDCLVHFADGVLCGRSNGADGVYRGAGPPRCFRDPEQACVRTDLRAADRVYAKDLRTSILFVDTCRGVKVDHDHGPSPWSMTLSALDGEAIAYIGSLRGRVGAEYAPELILDRLRHGASLGEAVCAANQAVTEDSAIQGSYVLIGDSGYIPYPVSLTQDGT